MLACIYSVNYVIQSFNNYFVFHTEMYYCAFCWSNVCFLGY